MKRRSFLHAMGVAAAAPVVVAESFAAPAALAVETGWIALPASDAVRIVAVDSQAGSLTMSGSNVWAVTIGGTTTDGEYVFDNDGRRLGGLWLR